MTTDKPETVAPLTNAVPLIILLVVVVVIGGAAQLSGPAVREATLLSFDRSAVGSFPTYSDAPSAATGFFESRDSADVTVIRDMSLGEFLALYHLSNHRAARAALRDQLGVEDDRDELRKGTRVQLPLSPR